MPEEAEIIREAVDRHQQGAEYLSENWRQVKDDLLFGLGGNQWPEKILKERTASGRRCLTINRAPSFIRQVVGNQRQMRPSIKVRPVDSISDPEQAEIRQDIIRHIEYKSKAKLAYDHGFTGAVSGGMGYWRVSTDYAGPDTFDQDIIIQRIFSPFSVVFDPNAVELDKSDAKWCFVTEWISRDEFKKTYPNNTPMDFSSAREDNTHEWVRKDEVMIAGYYEVVETPKKLYLLSNGQATDDIEILPEDTKVVKERDTFDIKVIYRIISGSEVLETKDWMGTYIPVIPCYGEEIYREGRPYYLSLIHWAKDAQRMYNYWSSTDTEYIALQPKAPYVGTAKQFEGYGQDWAAANTKNLAYLMYNHVQGVPPPQRQMPPQLSTAIGTAAMRSVDDMKATMGLFDPSMGEKSNRVESGRAITALQRQGETSTYVWIDNLTTAINHTGRIILELIPKIYDTARVFRIRGEDGVDKEFEVNTPGLDVENRPTLINDLSVGEYDVVVETGPSFATKRSEAADAMIKALQADPALMQKAGDLFWKNMDVPGADDLSDRYRKTLPPGLVEPEEGEPPPEPPQPTPQDQIEIQKLELEAEKLEVEKMKIEVDMEKVRVDAMNNEEDLAEKIRKGAMEVVREVHSEEGGT